MTGLLFNSMPLIFIAITASIVFPRELRNISGDRVDPLLNPVHAELKRLNGELTAICGHLDKQFKESRSSQEWKKIALVIDHLTFYLYLLFCVVSFITIGIVWHQSVRSIPKPEWCFLRCSRRGGFLFGSSLINKVLVSAAFDINYFSKFWRGTWDRLHTSVLCCTHTLNFCRHFTQVLKIFWNR